ncbi:hypothetical protein PMIT1342_01869 [Prochlorococcus marinus str. MIT 1342]|uniref:hypothetical protein n=1 Tax=Prochlorococcus TaxID=1218 RepID=UPI0007B35563|nr:hypothetical protein [Prochlorococcus marinus]KZR79924.1 hypothetical protein PMIT1342_01869 [Prochlorococcus marinus str. MIT 1342]
MKKINVGDLKKSFGIGHNEKLPDDTITLYEGMDLDYEEVSTEQQEKIIDKIYAEINHGFSRVGKERNNIWELAWKDLKCSFIENMYDVDSLIPSYISKHEFIRYGGKYIRPKSKNFEVNYFSIFRSWLFWKYIKEYSHIYEFGSGSGYNIIRASEMFPEKMLTGFDWSESSIEILNLYGKYKNSNVSGKYLNFYEPDYNIEIEPDSVVMSFCAFEQIGSDFQEVLKFIIKKKPALIVQVEPTKEYYDPSKKFDQIAIRYHEHRNYLDGYLKELKWLEVKGKLRILKSKRLYFGNIYNECFSYHIWKPI